MGALALAIALASWSGAPAFAAFSGKDTGTAGARFLKLPPGARAAAMGEAFGGVHGDIAAIHYNPAGLASLPLREAAFSHSEHLGFFRHDFLAYAQPLAGAGTLAASLNLLTQDSIGKVDNTGRELGESFSPFDSALTLAYARSFGEWRAGMGAKYIRQVLEDESASGFAADLGLQRSFGRAAAGLSMTNLGPGLRFRSVADPLPMLLRLSGSWEASAGLLLAADAGFPRDDEPFLRLGGEWRLQAGSRSLVLLRGGYRTETAGGLGALSGLSLGLGVGLGRWSSDFSFIPYGILGESYRLSLGFRF